MKKVAVILANGFEEGEALLVVDILRRAGIYCDIVSIVGTTPVGSHNIMIYADKLIEEVEKEEYDMIVLPGGQPGADHLRDSEEVINWVQDFSKREDKFIAAICAAPQVLQKAGILEGVKVTSYPSDKYRKLFDKENYVDDNRELEEMVLVDGNIITSRGPATTFPFAYKLVEVLGMDADTLKEKMLYNNC